MIRFFALTTLLVVGLSPEAAAQRAWTTDEWTVRESDGVTPLPEAYVSHGETFADMLAEASTWLASMGFREPEMERDPDNPQVYLARLKANREAISSVTQYNPSRTPTTRMALTGNLGMTSPSTATERLMWASPVHELLHASMWEYSGFRSQRLRENSDPAAVLAECPDGTDRSTLGWFNEGASSVLQIRWYEKKNGGSYGHPFLNPGTAAWVRYFDQPIHRGNTPAHLRDEESAAFKAEVARGKSWRCGYGTWPFWYFVGNALATEPGQEVEYLRYIMENNRGWRDGAVQVIDDGLRAAAREFGSSSRYDQGLYELYPEFIAQYANDWRFYETPEAVALEGDRGLVWASGDLEPLSSRAWIVRVDIPDHLGEGGSIPLNMTLASTQDRSQLHLIAGDRVIARPESDDDPYEAKLTVMRDTTILVRVSNVTPAAERTDEASFRLLFDLGGFYGGPVDGPQGPRSVSIEDLPEYDTAPGFNVLDGPESLIGCTGGIGQGASFDFINAAEATGDVRRMGASGVQDLDEMMEAMESGDLPIPNATAAQREAFRRARARGDANAAAMMTPEMREQIARAQAELAGIREEAEAEMASDMAESFPNRATIFATFTGYKGVGDGQECSVWFRAVVEGEEGGAQTLTLPPEEPSAAASGDGPMPIGIDMVEFKVGAGGPNAPPDPANDFQVCMMTQEEQARERDSGCPVVCSAGELAFVRAEQGHIQGQLRVDLVGPEDYDNRTGAGCPRVDRRTLQMRFNVASANSGQDTDVMRGVSDEMLRRSGLSQEAIDAMRAVDRRD